VKSRTEGRGSNWTLDGDTITVFIPMTWKRRGAQKVIIAPGGSDAWAPTKAKPDETLIRALARAHRWNRMLEAGKCRSIAKIAEAEKIDRSFVSRLLDLTLLAPDIQEAILEGRQPKGLQLEELTRAMPGAWRDQLQYVARAAP
jgi:predicted nucleic acid-binding Zn ribbon protein